MRRINFFGGPGSGKSKSAEKLSSVLGLRLCKQGKSIQLVQEFVKLEYVFKGRGTPTDWEQLDAFNGQLMNEYRAIKSGNDYTISDSPVSMSIAYALRCNFQGWHELIALSKKFDKEYPPLNIFLDRSGIKYEQCGRYEDEAGAKDMDARIRQFLDQHVHNYVVYKTIELEDRADEILAAL